MTLLPCPFCGAAPATLYFFGCDFYVECGCGASVKTSIMSSDGNYDQAWWDRGKAAVTDVWNTRADATTVAVAKSRAQVRS